MKHNPVAHFFGVVLLAATLLPGGPAIAQDKAAAVPAQAVKDERALMVLQGMSDTLAKAQTLAFRARTMVPFAMPSGQQISLFGASRVAMQRPDKLFVETRGDLFPHDLYFDGKTVTALAVEPRHYAQQAVAASTVEALIQTKTGGYRYVGPLCRLARCRPLCPSHPGSNQCAPGRAVDHRWRPHRSPGVYRQRRRLGNLDRQQGQTAPPDRRALPRWRTATDLHGGPLRLETRRTDPVPNLQRCAPERVHRKSTSRRPAFRHPDELKGIRR
jgi:hypothetical protein